MGGPVLRGEDEALTCPLPVRASGFPVGELLGALSTERGHALGWQCNATGRALRLRRDDQQFAADPL
ncbi:hypothetical protein [Streptomyces sp. NPDC001312]|uniref:hypothetical protein n=1 Tax=Streptomyces sp. NPDC001312 TaxID=3364561 RepID=UPI0036A84CEC